MNPTKSTAQGFLLVVAFCLTGRVSGQRIVFVDEGADAPVRDGSNWCRAYRNLSEALASVTTGTDTLIRVAGGTYWPNANDLVNPRQATFEIVSGVSIEGGYAGCGAVDSDRRDVRAHPTILSGDLDRDDDPLSVKDTKSDNSYHVVTLDGVSASTVLDGLTITAGNATGPSPDSFGGGVYIEEGAPTLQGCVFLGNNAEAGGAAANFYGRPTMVNCLFSGNSARNDGGAIFNDLSELTLVNCTLSGNTARIGAGIRNYAGVTLTLTNCVVWGNVAADGRTDEAAQIENTVSSTTANYSGVQGWTGTFGGVGAMGDDPQFVDADGPDDLYGTVDDNPRLQATSPCIDTGWSEGAPATDLDGHGRPCGAGVDMGTFESGECPVPQVRLGGSFLAVAWDDPVTGHGLLRAMNADSPWVFVTPALPIGRQAVVRASHVRLYAVSPSRATVTVVHPESWMVERVHSLEKGSDPLDIAVVDDETAYISRRSATHLLRLDLVTGATAEVVDLSLFADSDGVPDLGTMAFHEGRLFVQIRRLDSSAPGRFVRPAYLAVVDVRTEELIDVDPMTSGVQAIELAGTAPKGKMKIVPESRSLFVAATGQAFDAGGIEVVDLDLLESGGMVLREAEGRTGADLGSFVMESPDRGFLVYTTDLTISSHLDGFSVSGGVDPLPPMHTIVDYLAPTLELNAEARTLFFPSGGDGGNGVEVFDTVTGTRLTKRPTPTSGPPTDLVIFGESATRFLRGDCNDDGGVDISDGICALNWLFSAEGSTPGCVAALNTNGDPKVDISDPISLLTYLFAGGSPPVEPFPDCGPGRLPTDVETCETPQSNCPQ